MRSAEPGKPTSNIEVTDLSERGFRMVIDGRGLFVGFDNFPWFRGVPLAKLRNVQRPQPHHLYWPELDVDVAVESIEHPERFPLVSRPAG